MKLDYTEKEENMRVFPFFSYEIGVLLCSRILRTPDAALDIQVRLVPAGAFPFEKFTH